MSNKKLVTPQALKEMFLQQAWPLVQSYIDAATGEKELESLNAGCREEVWDLLKTLMLESSNKIEIQVDSPKDIIKAVESGVCTLEEGEKLLALYKQVKDIEYVGKEVTLGQSGITVNILNASTPEQLPAPVKVIENER